MARRVVHSIRASGLTIYDSLEGRLDLHIPTADLEGILDASLRGLQLDYPLRTRAKVLKQKVCESLGYPVPGSFRRTRPRFPGQDFDTCIQKSNNLQIWNEEVSPSRRYVIVRVDENLVVRRVRVVTGDVLALYDTTGTLTHKFQAKSREPVEESRLVSATDTPNVQRLMRTTHRQLLPIRLVFARVRSLLGSTVKSSGTEQERNRGAALHRAVAQRLGAVTPDTGRFPDIVEQLVEVKLQTAGTIDLGLVCPDSAERLALLPDFQHRDIRYAVFYGTLSGKTVVLKHVVVSSGADFFGFFRRFEGRIKNTKIQLHLPSDFFS